MFMKNDFRLNEESEVLRTFCPSMNRVVHFEIQVDDPDRAMKFYKDVFDWEFPKWMEEPPYWGVMTAPQDSKEPGINGGLLKRPAKTPSGEFGATSYVCTIEVENFDETAKKIEASGGKVAVPKIALQGIAWQGYFLDTEGNTFGLHQVDKDAK